MFVAVEKHPIVHKANDSETLVKQTLQMHWIKAVRRDPSTATLILYSYNTDLEQGRDQFVQKDILWVCVATFLQQRSRPSNMLHKKRWSQIIL